MSEPRLKPGDVHYDAKTNDTIYFILSSCVEYVNGEKICHVMLLDLQDGDSASLHLPLKYLGSRVSANKLKRLRAQAVKAAKKAAATAAAKKIRNFFQIYSNPA